jgi:hypothetical protein
MATAQKSCFQCGYHDHEQSNCHLIEQSQAGLDAFHRYQQAWLAAKKLKKTKAKSKTHHFLKFLQWVQRVTKAHNVCDPLVLASQHVIMQEGRPFGFELIKMVQLSYKEMFMDIIQRTRLRFSGETTKKDHDDLWEQALNQAVKAGEPADFSLIVSNRVYADNKLIFRTRYLYYLFMDSNPLSVKLRKKLLPGVASKICVASIGGGPVSI